MKTPKAQKTYVPTEKDLEKKWYLVDVKGLTLGPVATKIANVLRGKGKPHFTPQLDCGDQEKETRFFRELWCRVLDYKRSDAFVSPHQLSCNHD
jgi:hypothetical protein